MSKSKFIFVTGGVLSGLGKGVNAASLGRLLKSRGFKIFVQKFDPYYNPDPGTMSPYQHGEVYVTVDGGETDLDLGHYERFIDENFKKVSNVTQGKILSEILQEERQGKYDGHTIQVVPHITDKIINKLKEAERVSGADFIITEIGGTVGDIESQPFMYAMTQFIRQNFNNCYVIHTTYLPFLEASKEFKTKPTQHSISQLQSFGIVPNMILLRANRDIDKDIAKKVAEKALINQRNCIPIPNVENIFKIPLHFEKYNMAQIILEHFNLKSKDSDLTEWKKFVKLIDTPRTQEVKIALIGKYVEFEDAYKSIVEALKISSIWNKINVKIKWVQSGKLTAKNIATQLKNINGAIVLPGFGKRGFDGKVVAIKYLRDKMIPTLGICYGMQAMVIDQAKRKGIVDATSSEIDSEGSFVIDIIRGKKQTDNRGGTLRLGETETILVKNSIVSKLYGNASSAFERHRHRFEVNPSFVEKIEDEDFVFSGFDVKNNLAEVVELKNHPFFVGVQAHPEFNARPLKPHPLFEGLIKSIIKDTNK